MDENSHGVGRWKKSLTLEKYNTLPMGFQKRAILDAHLQLPTQALARLPPIPLKTTSNLQLINQA
jgi:hypothetical protein